jgi:hypothetical protein
MPNEPFAAASGKISIEACTVNLFFPDRRVPISFLEKLAQAESSEEDRGFLDSAEPAGPSQRL